MMIPRTRWVRAVLLTLSLAAFAGETVEHPFVGVTHITRTDAAPRPVKIHVLVIDLKAPGLRFLLTPPCGPKETIKQTTLQFITEQKAQIAVNVHFFEPWPAPNPDDGSADLVGFAASSGTVYSGFEDKPPKPYAIQANAPAINIDPANVASIVHRDPADATGRSIAEPVKLHTAFAGNEQLLTAGKITAGEGKWDNTPNPLTVIGIPKDKLVILLVDGRQKAASEGLSTREAAELLRKDYGVMDAINLDGGGSATLCMADAPDAAPRVVNVPVGIGDKPGTLRPVGSNLAIFARVPTTGPDPVEGFRRLATQPATTPGGRAPVLRDYLRQLDRAGFHAVVQAMVTDPNYREGSIEAISAFGVAARCYVDGPAKADRWDVLALEACDAGLPEAWRVALLDVTHQKIRADALLPDAELEQAFRMLLSQGLKETAGAIIRAASIRDAESLIEIARDRLLNLAGAELLGAVAAGDLGVAVDPKFTSTTRARAALILRMTADCRATLERLLNEDGHKPPDAVVAAAEAALRRLAMRPDGATRSSTTRSSE